MLRELDNRNSDGISVSLLWDEDSGETFVEIEDCRNDSVATFAVPGDEAREAFEHPYPYLFSSSCTNPGFSVRV